jgi:hypothetical protein
MIKNKRRNQRFLTCPPLKANKRGWIRIVEAFIAVLLIAGVLLFVINKGYIGKRDISEQVYEVQLSVLREIELDSDLRLQILKSEEGSVPEEVVNKTNERMPDYLECTSRICDLEVVCPIPEGYFIEKDIYAQAVAISAEGEEYGPKQLKLFCWTAG